MNIYPSVLETDTETFVKRIQTYAPIFPHMQIDIADAVLVNNKTIQIDDIAQLVTSNQLPVTINNTFEFHLMVKDWQKELSKLAQLSSYMTITQVFVHANVLSHSVIPNSFRDLIKMLNQVQHDLGVELGFALNPEDSIEQYWKLITEYKHVLIMTVTPGKQGSEFLPAMVDKVDELREAGYKGTITLDGGINGSTLKTILSHKHWPDGVCPGSYFHEDTDKKLQKLYELVSSYQQDQ